MIHLSSINIITIKRDLINSDHVMRFSFDKDRCMTTATLLNGETIDVCETNKIKVIDFAIRSAAEQIDFYEQYVLEMADTLSIKQFEGEYNI